MAAVEGDVTGGANLGPILVRELAKIYRQKGSGRSVVAIEHLDFVLQPGQFVCVVGPTGCGKSTFFKILCGLEEPTRGEVLLGGRRPYRDFQWFKGKIGIIFQQDRLLPWRTALQNVELALEVAGTEPARSRELATEWLERLGLKEFLHAYPGELSGGMRQRVAMARAFVLDPPLLLADEAFGHLDEVTAARLREDFARLSRSRGTTVILITHQLEEAIQVGDRILAFGRPARLLADLNLREEGAPPEELRARLQHLLQASQGDASS